MTNTRNEIDIAELRSIMWCDPKTGIAYWYPRPGDTKFNKRYAGKPVGSPDNRKSAKGRLKFIYKGKNIFIHRAVYAIIKGHWPLHEIDHINGDPSDNRIENLRDVPHVLNMRNMLMRKGNRSGALGVQYRPERNKPWIARCKAKGHPVVYVSFYTKEEAEAKVASFRKKHDFHENHGRKAG
jgi:hypothetical protein